MLLSFRKLFSLSFLFCTLLTICGCASILGNRSKQVAFDTSPPGADVYIDGFRVGKTPIAVNLLLDVHKSDIELYRRKSARKKMKAERRSGRKTDKIEDSVLVIKNQYKVVVVKEGFKTIQFSVTPKTELSFAPNRGLCTIDIAISVLTFGVPMIINSSKHACSGFENVYHFNLYSGSSGTVPLSESYNRGILADSLVLGGNISSEPGQQGVKN